MPVAPGASLAAGEHERSQMTEEVNRWTNPSPACSTTPKEAPVPDRLFPTDNPAVRDAVKGSLATTFGFAFADLPAHLKERLIDDVLVGLCQVCA